MVVSSPRFVNTHKLGDLLHEVALEVSTLIGVNNMSRAKATEKLGNKNLSNRVGPLVSCGKGFVPSREMVHYNLKVFCPEQYLEGVPCNP